MKQFALKNMSVCGRLAGLWSDATWEAYKGAPSFTRAAEAAWKFRQLLWCPWTPGELALAARTYLAALSMPAWPAEDQVGARVEEDADGVLLIWRDKGAHAPWFSVRIPWASPGGVLTVSSPPLRWAESAVETLSEAA